MKEFLLVLVLSGGIAKTFAQAHQSRIDRKDLQRFVRVFSADSLEGRGTGTEGNRKAQRFISNRFKELGLIPYDTSGYLEKYQLKQGYWGQVYLKTAKTKLINFENLVLLGSQAQNEEIEKEVIFGGSGSETELSQIEVKDRLVLVFVNNLRSYYDLNKRLASKHAYGLIIANPNQESQSESIKNTFRDHTLQKRLLLLGVDTANTRLTRFLDTLKMVNTLIIPNSQIRNLMGTSVAGLVKLADAGRIKDVPVRKVSVKFEWVENILETANVIGTIKGKTDTTILISAHYDHLGKEDKRFFPGADDNASGTAALLELAEEFAGRNDLNYTLTFIATSAEEAGLLGSRYHVSQPGFIPDKILYNLNIDMVGRRDAQHSSNNYLYCIGIGQLNEIDRAIREADELQKDCSIDYSLNKSEFPTGLFTRSDNYSFYQKGIVALLFYSGIHPDYHKTTDTADKIDFMAVEKRIRLIATVIDLLETKSTKN